MEVVIYGPGEVLICLMDPKGKTLIQEKIVSSGFETIECKKDIALTIKTTSGTVPIVPVVVRSDKEQRVTFDKEEFASFVRRRCKEIGCSEGTTKKALTGQADLLDASANAVTSSFRAAPAPRSHKRRS